MAEERQRWKLAATAWGFCREELEEAAVGADQQREPLKEPQLLTRVTRCLNGAPAGPFAARVLWRTGRTENEGPWQEMEMNDSRLGYRTIRRLRVGDDVDESYARCSGANFDR
ncbi:unnamed protein product [Urochloa humidicola]